MDLRMSAEQQRRIRGNLHRLLNDQMTSDSEFDDLIDSTVGTLNAGIVGTDGMLDAERNQAAESARKSAMPDLDLFSPEEDSDPSNDSVFDDEDDEGNNEYEADEENSYGYVDDSDITEDETTKSDSGDDAEVNDESPGYTSLDGALHDAELPWRPTRPDLGVSGDVSNVIPGTVIDRGPSGFTTSSQDDEDDDEDDEDNEDTPAVVKKPRQVKRPKLSRVGSGLRGILEDLLGRWSGYPAVVRIAIPLVIVLAVVGLLISMCGHSEPAIKTNNNAGNAPSAPVDTAPEEEHQQITLMPKTVKDFCPSRSTHATLAFTGNSKNAWVCMRAHNSDGARFEIYFDAPVVITSLCVVPGWNYVEPNGKNHWSEHRLVTKILWRLGGQQLTQEINPVPGGACLAVPNIATVSMSGTIQATIEPPVSNEGPLGGLGNDKKVNESFAIGSITITGYPAGK